MRYIGIDTPEYGREGTADACYAEEATVHNTSLVEGRKVRLERDSEDRDTYMRLLRHVYVDDVFVQESLVAGGYADTLVIPPNTQHQKVLYEAKRSARIEGAGMWGACQ